MGSDSTVTQLQVPTPNTVACRLFPVVSEPWPSDDVQSSTASVLPPWTHQFDALLPTLHLSEYSPAANPGATTSRLSIPAAQQLFMQHLSLANERMSNVWEPDTVRRRKLGMQELDAWLKQMPLSWGLTLMTCTPSDILSYMEGHWLRHQGSVLLDGSNIASLPVGSTNVCPIFPLASQSLAE